MKILILNIFILCISINCFGQENRDTNRVILPINRIWSIESEVDSPTRCKSELADSLSQLSSLIITDSLSLENDSTRKYTYQFYKKTEWRTDFKNRPVYIHNCYGLNINEKIDLFSIKLTKDEEFDILLISKHLDVEELEISSFTIGEEIWLVVRSRVITMLGNSKEGVDYEFYFKKY